MDSSASVYDMGFVELAAGIACPLVTFDQTVLKAFLRSLDALAAYLVVG